MNRECTPSIVFSSINFAHTQYALRSKEWLGQFSRQIQCDGVELMPFLDLVPGHTPKAIGRAVASGALQLNSLHAAFRTDSLSYDTHELPGEKPPAPDQLTSMIGKIIRGPLGRIIMPEVCESAKTMAAIQHETGVKVPAVLYPQRLRYRDRSQVAHCQSSGILFQPTDHVARLIESDTLESFDVEMHERRSYSYVLDLFHVRRRYGRDKPGLISNTKESVPFMAPHTRALHLSLARTDIRGEDHINTAWEALEAENGRYSGELRDMLDTVKALGNVEYVTIEAPLNGLVAATGRQGLRGASGVYKSIVDGFRDYWQRG